MNGILNFKSRTRFSSSPNSINRNFQTSLYCNFSSFKNFTSISNRNTKLLVLSKSLSNYNFQQISSFSSSESNFPSQEDDFTSKLNNAINKIRKEGRIDKSAEKKAWESWERAMEYKRKKELKEKQKEEKN